MKHMTPPVNFLLVDDLDENLLALEALLQRDGLVCLKAHSGEEALELLLVHNVALALLGRLRGCSESDHPEVFRQSRDLRGRSVLLERP